MARPRIPSPQEYRSGLNFSKFLGVAVGVPARRVTIDGLLAIDASIAASATVTSAEANRLVDSVSKAVRDELRLPEEVSHGIISAVEAYLEKKTVWTKVANVLDGAGATAAGQPAARPAVEPPAATETAADPFAEADARAVPPAPVATADPEPTEAPMAPSPALEYSESDAFSLVMGLPDWYQILRPMLLEYVGHAPASLARKLLQVQFLANGAIPAHLWRKGAAALFATHPRLSKKKFPVSALSRLHAEWQAHYEEEETALIDAAIADVPALLKRIADEAPTDAQERTADVLSDYLTALCDPDDGPVSAKQNSSTRGKKQVADAEGGGSASKRIAPIFRKMFPVRLPHESAADFIRRCCAQDVASEFRKSYLAEDGSTPTDCRGAAVASRLPADRTYDAFSILGACRAALEASASANRNDGKRETATGTQAQVGYGKAVRNMTEFEQGTLARALDQVRGEWVFAFAAPSPEDLIWAFEIAERAFKATKGSVDAPFLAAVRALARARPSVMDEVATAAFADIDAEIVNALTRARNA